jgi:hypothetical protein
MKNWKCLVSEMMLERDMKLARTAFNVGEDYVIACVIDYIV